MDYHNHMTSYVYFRLQQEGLPLLATLIPISQLDVGSGRWLLLVATLTPVAVVSSRKCAQAPL